MFLQIEYGNNHGMSQGIIPRFYLQMADLAELGIGKNEFDERSNIYFEKVIPDITNIYDIYHKLETLIEDYKAGVSKGVYFTVDERGHSSFNRQNEVEIKNLTKDFIIRCKIAIVNFVKCGFADEGVFKLQSFFFVDHQKFNDRKKQYLKSTDGKYLPLINLIEKANGEFLKPLNDIRGEIEHNLFTLSKFVFNRNAEGAVWLDEPTLQGETLSEKIKYYYEKSLEFIEKTMVYFIGINGEHRMPGFLELHVDDIFDYSNMNYKYRFSLGGTPWSFTSKRCMYD